MAKVNIRKTLVSGIYGIFDIGMEEFDKIKGWTEPFKNATDITRAIATIGSGIVNYMGIETEYSEALFYSSLPLLEKSVYKVVKGFIKFGYTPRASEVGFRREIQSQPQAPTITTRITSY